jgi:hypothetical protein
MASARNRRSRQVRRDAVVFLHSSQIVSARERGIFNGSAMVLMTRKQCRKHFSGGALLRIKSLLPRPLSSCEEDSISLMVSSYSGVEARGSSRSRFLTARLLRARGGKKEEAAVKLVNLGMLEEHC